MSDSFLNSNSNPNLLSSWIIGVGSTLVLAIVIVVGVYVYAKCRRIVRSSNLNTITYEMQRRAEIELRTTITSDTKARPPCALPDARLNVESSNECVYNYVRRSQVAASDFQSNFGYYWEIKREELKLGGVVGKGMSGIVVKAQYTGRSPSIPNIVAIKTTAGSQGVEEELSLFAEMKMMKMIGKHPNIVNLFGSCTSNGPLYLIIEYAMHGNLRDFLQRNSKSKEGVGIGESIDHELLVRFAYQIAMGMKFLIGQGCIHRDLAARNVLVSEGYVLKICDFGLAKFVGSLGYYRRIGDEILPIRWMAPEAIVDGIFSSKSDVWSYGVLLWEIMSYGAEPYADLRSSDELLQLLPTGYRMERPDDCSLQTYSIMKKCWKYEAEERPTFGVLLRDTFSILPKAKESVTSDSKIYTVNEMYPEGSNFYPAASNLSKTDIEEAPMLYYEKIL